MLLHGVFPPITTPFYPDGNVYFKKLESNVERYSRTPCAGIVVLGSTGEAILLSDQERRDVLKSAREAATPNKVLIAGTGIESAIETLRPQRLNGRFNSRPRNQHLIRRRRLTRGFKHIAPLLIGKKNRLAGRTEDDDASARRARVSLDITFEFLEVHIAVGIERRSDGRKNTVK